jgi:hypothetical protein
MSSAPLFNSLAADWDEANFLSLFHWIYTSVHIEGYESIIIITTTTIITVIISGQISCLHFQRSWVRFPALPAFLRSKWV